MAKWKPEETALFSTHTNAEIAQQTGRTWKQVASKRWSLGIPSPENGAGIATSVCSGPGATQTASTYKEDKVQAGDSYWANQYSALERKYKSALAEASVVDRLVDDIESLAPRSYSSTPSIKITRKSSGHSQSAVLLFSDTHVGKVVCPDQTLGFGRYDFPTFLARLKYLEESVISILENHTTTKIDELVIAMLGDMLDGALLHGVEAGQRNTLFSQFYLAGHAIAQAFRAIAARVPQVRIKTVVGNHTRWQNQRKMPTENRYSNLDMFLYALIEALTKDIKNIQWDLNQQPFAIFEVQGFVFHASHGDHLRGGDKALGIPNHAIGREISTKTQLFVKNKRTPPHYYVSGHLHRDIKIPHAFGDVTINGGFPGLDNYALGENFNPVDPKQDLFFVHQVYGKTAEYKLSLKFAEVGEPPYQLPTSFPLE